MAFVVAPRVIRAVSYSVYPVVDWDYLRRYFLFPGVAIDSQEEVTVVHSADASRLCNQDEIITTCQFDALALTLREAKVRP